MKIDLLESLELRGGMYMNPFNYDTLCAFINGYEIAYKENQKESQIKGLEDLVYLKFGTGCALHWSGVILAYFSEGDKEKAIKIFFNIIKDLKRIKKERPKEFLELEMEKLRQLKQKRKTELNWPYHKQKDRTIRST